MDPNGNGAVPQGVPPDAGGFQRGTGNFPQGGQFRGGPGGFAGRGGAFRASFFLGPYTGWILIGVLVLTYVVMAISFWQFLRKAGLTPAIALAMLIPVVNLGVALWVAFIEWPVLKVLARL